MRSLCFFFSCCCAGGLLVPLALLAVPGVLFLSAAGWMVMGWFLLLWWCAAPLLGSALAWLVWAVSLRKSGRGAGKTGRKVL